MSILRFLAAYVIAIAITTGIWVALDFIARLSLARYAYAPPVFPILTIFAPTVVAFGILWGWGLRETERANVLCTLSVLVLSAAVPVVTLALNIFAHVKILGERFVML